MPSLPVVSHPLVEERLDLLIAQHDPGDVVAFWGAQFDLGLAWVHFPEGLGGLGVEPRFQEDVTNRLRELGASFDNYTGNVIGLGMGAPTILAHGSIEQQQRWLRPLFTTEEVWCQLFSEPGAGSDLAGLGTRAIPDGDEWVVQGEKVWTSLAQTARWGLLLARTDPDVPKHQGLTYFVVDVHQPGVEVRPLRQITGEAEFNQVFLTGARIPDSDRLGDVGDGWRVSLTTLMHERVAIGAASLPRGGGPIAGATALWREKNSDDPYLRDELMKLWVEAEVLRLTNQRANHLRARGTPGPEGSTAKLHWAELNKRITEFTIGLLDARGMLYPGGFDLDHRQPSTSSVVHKSFLRARANSIEGGTSEIMRNILGERVLGLAGEPRSDKAIPWKDIPVG